MDYTEDQKKAIETIDKNLQIIACAGSGKTQVISARIVHLLKSSSTVTPANIVAFTYTEKAAAELKDRVYNICRKILGTDEGLGDMYIGTIHGYCLNLLQEPPLYKYLKYQVLSEVHQRLFIDRNSSRTGLTQTPLLRGGLLRRWMDSKLYQTLLSIRFEAEVDLNLISDEVIGCLDLYKGYVDANKYLDYTTILTDAYDALKNHTGLRNKIENQVRYLIVDEYQDVNPLQELIIRELFDLCGNICVVGDDDQTIYQWRGSDVENIITLTDRYPSVEQIPLNMNFRSSRGIVEASRQFVERVPTRLSKAMESSDTQPTDQGDILALEFNDPDQEALWIGHKIRDLYGTYYKDKPSSEPRGLTYSDMAILLRSVRRDARPIMQALSSLNIPYIVSGMDGLFDTIEIQVLQIVFNYLADFAPRGQNAPTEDEVRTAIESAGFGLSEAEIDNGMAFIKERKSRITQEMHAELYLQRLYIDFLAAIQLREENIDKVNDSTRTGEIVYYNLGKFSNVISDFETINFHSVPVNLYREFCSFLYYQAHEYYPEGWEDNSCGRPDAVQILTVHKAKGMQWPAVFIPCLRNNRFPSRRQGGRSVWHVIPDNAVKNSDRYRGTEEDERRLFYVALTRAEKYLYCTWAPIQSNQQQRRISQFFRDFTNNEHVLTREFKKDKLPMLEPSSRQEDVTLPLTFTELKYYFICPYLFKLRFLYGFDTPINRALGYGKSLHNALAEIHAESINGRIPGIDEVDRIVDDHLNLPFANAAVEQNLRGTAREALTRYLNDHGHYLDKLEHVEKVVELKLADGVVVNGRIDLIRRTDTNEVLIVDFKSREISQAEDITQRQLHVYAVGYEQLTGNKPDMIEIHNLDKGGAKREVVDDELTTATIEVIMEAGHSLRENRLLRHSSWCEECNDCDLTGICRSS